MLWQGMEEFKIPKKLINMCKTCVQKTRSAVRIDGTLDRVENFPYLDVILNEDNNHQIDLQERIKNANKTYLMLQIFLEIKIYLKN
jgi:hypothetical protein